MKISLSSGRFITDNSLECESGCYFVRTNSNLKFESTARTAGAEIIAPKRALELAGSLSNLKIVGITGTNGKTTTAALTAHILTALGHKCALAGTRGAFVDGEQIAPKGLTTSQFLETLSYMWRAVEAGCEYFIMEVSSHAIAQNRVEGLEFALKIFTNLTQDHLDYHKTFEEYARVKSSFFADETLKLINADDEFIRYSKINAHLYAIEDSNLNNAEFTATEADFSRGITATLNLAGEQIKFNSHLQGKFNLYNILAAAAAVRLLEPNSNLNALARAIESFPGVEGRVQVVSRNPLVIVDFAHTPDGIEKVLSALNHKRLIVVFGAGGDRDRTKRPLMGAAVEKYAHTAIVTSDNPRSEEPSEIANEILSGMKSERTICELDRRKAISLAISLAKEDDIVAILGKGDETTQEIKGAKYHFSDAEVVREILEGK